MEFIEKYILTDVLKKVVASAVKLVASFATAHGIALVAAYHGYAVNVQDQAGLTVLFNSALKAAEHYLSQKYPALAFLNTVDDAPDGMPPASVMAQPLCAAVLPPAPAPATPPTNPPANP